MLLTPILTPISTLTLNTIEYIEYYKMTHRLIFTLDLRRTDAHVDADSDTDMDLRRDWRSHWINVRLTLSLNRISFH